MPGLSGLFGPKAAGHPLADPVQRQHILDDLPVDNAYKALDEISGWLESLQAAGDFPRDRIYEAARQLELAAQPHLKRLAHEYLHTARLTRNDEKRLWTINHGFWTLLAAAYERGLPGGEPNPRAATELKNSLPLLATRLIAALGASLKWERFRYGPTPGQVWLRLGKVLALAELAGVADKSTPQPGGPSSARQEYLKIMAFHAASTDTLLPLEVEIAERLIKHFLPLFVFTDAAEEDSVYWVDLKLPQQPLRLAQMPAQASWSQRFFKPGKANAAIVDLLRQFELGRGLPPDLDFGEQYEPRQLLPVLRHLAAYLAPVPPQRRFDRHRVKHRMSVLNGLVNAYVVFSGDFGSRPAGLPMESWVVENVSRGGFGTQFDTAPADWVKVGALVALQPDGGDNWLLGVVRRYNRETEQASRVGIEAIARQAFAVELKPRSASATNAAAAIPALLLAEDAKTEQVRLILPAAAYDSRQSYEYALAGQRYLLLPVAVVERSRDYEIARFRQNPLA